MKYGFVIDNRKCIGCHACTTACKSEHDVAVGVNRTWVKYVEKGTFPDSKRLFSVMRCNHCTDAPCVEICPVESLFIRDDGIVDFDNRRCIGCKSCMQACPYDALYIDPKTNTAAKCNYCTHRVDIGLEPACVNVCPVGAIVSGDIENPETNIAKLISRHPVTVRKGEKGTNPNLFYIDGDQASLQPSAAMDDVSMWSSQTLGVGHYAKEAEKMAFTNPDVISAIQEGNKEKALNGTTILDVMKGKPRKAYQAPEKGIMWGWEVSGYVFTKAISAGSFLVLFLSTFFGVELSDPTYWWTFGMGLFFLMATGVLLVMDLDQPTRFLNVLLRPQWKSWLVKGGYAITIYGGLISVLAGLKFFGIDTLNTPLMYLTGATAVIVAIYTAFLFAQAKGRDFWQSPTLVIHMLVHSFMAGAAAFGILTAIGVNDNEAWMGFLKTVMVSGIIINFLTIIVEITITHPTSDAKKTVKMITKGRYKNLFWGGVMFFGNILPVAILTFMGLNPITLALAGIIVLVGIYFTEKIWVEAPQRIPLS